MKNRIYKWQYWLVSGLLLALCACGNPRSDGLQLGEERSTSNEADITEQMIDSIKQVMLSRHPTGIVKRFNQPKSLGCFDARFTVADALPPKLAQGIFAEPQVYPAKIRFASATKDDDRDKDFRGMSIKVFNVRGESLWGQAGQQDFILNSYPVLFARDGSDFLEFIEATRKDKLWQYFIRPSHFYSLKTVLQGRSKDQNPFAVQYWSTTPFRHGENKGTAVKYSVRPCDANSTQLQGAQTESENQLTDAMAESLKQASACFDFMVQFQTDPQAMPIEDASVHWDEKNSPFQKVASIQIENQPFTTPVNRQACEAMTFNPWQSLAAHQPLGDINRLRRAVYAESAEFRLEQNKQRTN